jgi:hypothetical protein
MKELLKKEILDLKFYLSEQFSIKKIYRNYKIIKEIQKNINEKKYILNKIFKTKL